MKNLELYLHVPFCVQKCAYCDFLSAAADRAAQSRYIDGMLQEINQYRDSCKDYQVSTIFIGGGTPSMLLGGDIHRIFFSLRQSFAISKDAEITIEANPGTVTDEKLTAWQESGVNRLSIGLQSADNRELQLLGRIHTFEQFQETYEKARKAGFHNINIDLMAGIPGQTLNSYEQTLEAVTALEPEHISAYSLIVEAGTMFGDIYQNGRELRVDHKGGNSGYPPLPDEETDRLMYERTEAVLKKQGYLRYEISNYARPGYECRHNLGYWEREEYLGIGLGASSLIDNTRFKQVTDLETYIHNMKQGKMAAVEIEKLTLADQMAEFMFLGLRKMAGVSAKKFFQYFSQDIYAVYESPLSKLKKAGLIEISDDSIRLTNRGIDISNYVFAEFL